MTTWNRQINGDRKYHEESLIKTTETLAAGATRDLKIPWGVDGFTRGTFDLVVGSVGGNPFTFRAYIVGLRSDDDATSLGAVASNRWQWFSDIVAAAGLSGTSVIVTFSDRPLPGNVFASDPSGTVLLEGSTNLNPVMLGNTSNLIIRIEADSGNVDDMNLFKASALLSGD